MTTGSGKERVYFEEKKIVSEVHKKRTRSSWKGGAGKKADAQNVRREGEGKLAEGGAGKLGEAPAGAHRCMICGSTRRK